jgi:hypothetical protein
MYCEANANLGPQPYVVAILVIDQVEELCRSQSVTPIPILSHQPGHVVRYEPCISLGTRCTPYTLASYICQNKLSHPVTQAHVHDA